MPSCRLTCSSCHGRFGFCRNQGPRIDRFPTLARGNVDLNHAHLVGGGGVAEYFENLAARLQASAQRVHEIAQRGCVIIRGKRCQAKRDGTAMRRRFPERGPGDGMVRIRCAARATVLPIGLARLVVHDDPRIVTFRIQFAGGGVALTPYGELKTGSRNIVAFDGNSQLVLVTWPESLTDACNRNFAARRIHRGIEMAGGAISAAGFAGMSGRRAVFMTPGCAGQRKACIQDSINGPSHGR